MCKSLTSQQQQTQVPAVQSTWSQARFPWVPWVPAHPPKGTRLG